MCIVPITAVFRLTEVAGAYVAAMSCLLGYLFVDCVMCWVLCAGAALHQQPISQVAKVRFSWLTSAAFRLLCCAGAGPQGAVKCCLLPACGTAVHLFGFSPTIKQHLLTACMAQSGCTPS